MKLFASRPARRALEEGGLADVQEKPLEIEQRFTSFDDYWGPFLKGTGRAGRTSLRSPRSAQAARSAPARPPARHRADGAFTLKARACACAVPFPARRA